jgi:subtilisin family serine protease
MRGGKAEVRVSVSRVDGSVLERMESAGATVLFSSARYRQVILRVGASELDELAAIPEVQRIAPAWRPRLQTGTVVTQGDASMLADVVRNSPLSLSGSGVTIGILSDSFQRGAGLGGSVAGSGCSRAVTGMTNQTSLDLPASVGLLDDCDQDLGTCGGDPSDDSFCCSVAGEGAAMGEILHDVAPSSPLLFHTAFYSEADFALGIEELVDCGAGVLVDDVVWFEEPMFEDGIIAQAAQAATEAGAAYYSSAGNYSTFGIDDIFVDDVPGSDDENDPAPGAPPSGDDFHDFATDDPYAAVNFPVDCGVIAILQWDEPWESLADPGGGTVGAESDLDLYFCYGEDPATCGDDPMDGGGALRSATRQGCGANGGGPAGDPIEILEIINVPPDGQPGSPATGHFVVEHHCGNQADLRFRIATLPSNGCSYPGSFDFEDGVGGGNPIWVDAQIFGQAAARDAVAVAAVFYDEKDQGGDVDPPTGVINVEAFSSIGGDLPFAGGTRQKPEITGPDCGNNTFYGGDLGDDVDSSPNFCGTSAAAPHVAGVAALLRQANPALRPTQIREILQSTALDIESAGVDARSGSGFVVADSAAGLACNYLGVTPAKLDYGTLPLVGASRDLEVVLTQPACASGSAVVSPPIVASGDFTPTTGGSTPCASLAPTLAPGTSCTFEVSFDPSATGAVVESLTVTSNQPSVDTPLIGDAIDCTSDADLTLDNTTVTDDTSLQACDTIVVGPSVDVTTGDLSLLAGVSITFENGTAVIGPGTLAVALDSILATP